MTRILLVTLCAGCAATAARPPAGRAPAPADARLLVEADSVALIVDDRRLRLAAAGRTDAQLSTFAVDGRTAWKIDLYVADGPRFARREILVERAPSGQLVKTFDRLVESASGALVLYANVTSRDVDGDGRDELVVEERATGGRRQTLVYRRGADGQFRTDGVSLWKVVP
ncbi:MAG TPA: hypothetical protein VKE22_26900 [Haliangiales bacterium]|nr:hypothetical protein [Haliangiales bacterium]